MFTQRWREYWGLSEDPFTCEDADKDVILSSLDPSMVHWSFDRMYGNPRMPAPGIVFGEKGSGKSALRLMMRRRIETHNQANPDAKVFLVEYIDFNAYLHQFRRSIGARNDSGAAAKVMNRWSISDHLDSILSLGVSQLVDEALTQNKPPEGMNRKERAYLGLHTALYYSSTQRTQMEALTQIMRRYKLGSFRPFFRWFLIILLTLVGVGVAIQPFFVQAYNAANPEQVINFGPAQLWHALGLAILAGIWGAWFYRFLSVRTQAARASRAIKTLPRNPGTAKHLLEYMSAAERKEYVLPLGSDESSRYHQLQWFMTLLERFGYKGLYVLVDRVDEPSLLSAKDDLMRAFIERLLDIKLLQFPNLGVKLFLPIELDAIHRNATPEQLKRMRLDKSNLVPELKWSGNELYDIADQRLKLCLQTDARAQTLTDLFIDDFNLQDLKETLDHLGTPRYAFGFLSNLFTEYVKALPNDLPETDASWKISRSEFDVVRSSWMDRTGVLRRVLN